MDVYEGYLRWFGARAREGVRPWARENLFDCFLFSRTLSESAERIEDEAYFIVWLTPEESRSGAAAWFTFSERIVYRRDAIGDAVFPPIEKIFCF